MTSIINRSYLAIVLSFILIGTVSARGGGGAFLCPDVNGAGAGWGVGFVDINLSPENVIGPLTVNQVTVTSPDRRVFYPGFAFNAPDQKVKEILTERPTLPPFVQGIVRNAMDNARPRCRVFFLFLGNQPLRVDIGTNPPIAFNLVPMSDSNSYYTVLNQWFSHFMPEDSSRPTRLSAPAPSMIKSYLRSMLVYRLGLNPEALGQKESPWNDASPFNFVTATPELRAKMPYISYFEDESLNAVSIDNGASKDNNPPVNNNAPGANDAANAVKSALSILDNPEVQPNNEPQSPNDSTAGLDESQKPRLNPIAPSLFLPSPDRENLDLDADVEVEQISLRVPKDCLYIRFGSFKNFIWFQNLSQNVEGNLLNLLAAQSVDANMVEKIQTTLSSRLTEMSKALGQTVIKDVALIGSDLFFDDGSSIGLLFHSSNNFLLSAGINNERAAAVKKNPSAKEKTVTIAGKKVKYLSTPDGKIQSYYVVDGMFHLITSSKTLVEQFLKTSKNKEDSLGTQPYFRYARTQMPLSNKYTVFAYTSEDFLYRLVSPQYWTEISRRRRSAAEIEMTILAQQAAANEGVDCATIEDLVKYGYLPKSAIIRPDGSRLQFDENGVVYDTLRGYSGCFHPAADVNVEGLSDYELARYEAMRQSFQENVVQLSPLMVGFTVKSTGEDRSQLHIDARVAPFARAHFEKVKGYFGPLDSVRFAPIPGDCIQAQAILNNARLLIGVRNDIPYQGRTGRIVRDVLTGIFGNDLGLYFGTTNEHGFIGLLGTFNIIPGRPTAQYSIHSKPDIDMRYRDQHIRLFSFQPEIPPQVEPYLRYETAESPQHVWISVNNPMGAPVGNRINNMFYALSARTSLRNLITLQTMVQQLGVPSEQAMNLFETCANSKMVSPIGGQYVYQTLSPTHGYWTDTALGYANMRNLGWFSVQAPQGYLAQPWTWFIGGDFQFKIEPQNVQFSATIDMVDLGK